MKKITFLLLFAVNLSCSNRGKTPAGFDPDSWQKDPKGCAGKRVQLADSIILHKKEWKGLDDDVLIDLLGKPEQTFYYERSSKAFGYYIEPGAQCDTGLSKAQGRQLIAEINAIGYVHMIRIQR